MKKSWTEWLNEFKTNKHTWQFWDKNVPTIRICYFSQETDDFGNSWAAGTLHVTKITITIDHTIDDPITIFVVKYLEQLYQDNVIKLGIKKQCHVSRFGKQLSEETNDLGLRKVSIKLTIYFQDIASVNILDNMSVNAVSKSLHAIDSHIRTELYNTSNLFNSFFNTNSQEESVPLNQLEIAKTARSIAQAK